MDCNKKDKFDEEGEEFKSVLFVVNKNDLNNFTRKEFDNYVVDGDDERESKIYVYGGK